MVKIFPDGDVTKWDFSSQYSNHHRSRQPFSLVTLVKNEDVHLFCSISLPLANMLGSIKIKLFAFSHSANWISNIGSFFQKNLWIIQSWSSLVWRTNSRAMSIPNCAPLGGGGILPNFRRLKDTASAKILVLFSHSFFLSLSLPLSLLSLSLTLSLSETIIQQEQVSAKINFLSIYHLTELVLFL